MYNYDFTTTGGWLNKGKTHFISLFPFKLNNASRKFFFYIIAHYIHPILRSGHWFLSKFNERQDLGLHVGQNVCRLILTIDEK